MVHQGEGGHACPSGLDVVEPNGVGCHLPRDTRGHALLVSEKETAKVTWEALKIMHMGVERVKDAKVQTLKMEFEGLCMKESESIDDFAARLTTIVNKVRALGEKFEENYAVKKFLRAIPNKFLQIA